MPENQELALLQQDVTYLRKTVDDLSCMVKEVINDLKGRVIDLETSVVVLNERTPVLKNRLDCLEVELGIVQEKVPEDLHSRVKTLEKISTSFRPALRILAFVGSSLLALIIGLIWALITGKVTLH